MNRHDGFNVDYVIKSPEIEIEIETDKFQMARNLSKGQEVSASLSSSEVDFVLLCEDIVKKIKEILKRRIVLNRSQCDTLATKLSEKVACIREVVELCGRDKDAFEPLLKTLYRHYRKAEVLVEQCGGDDWCLAAVFQLGNTASFSYIERHINLVGIGILEHATKYSAVPSTTSQCAFPSDVAESSGLRELKDEDDLRVLLESSRNWKKSSNPQTTLRLHLAQYLLKKIRFNMGKKSLKHSLLKKINDYLLFKHRSERHESEVLKSISWKKSHESEVLKSISWKKSNECPRTWGEFKFLGDGYNQGLWETSSLRVLCANLWETSWLGVPCALKSFPLALEPMFMKEASIMARLKYPCIVDFICCGNGSQKNLFIAMELMEKSLFGLLKERKSSGAYFSLDVGLDIIWQIADGVRFLHEVDVAHCKLKPKNVVVRTLRSPYHEDYYCVKLMNFGSSQVEYLNVQTPTVMDKMRWFKKDAHSFAMTCEHVLSLSEPFENFSECDIHEMAIAKEQRPNLRRVCHELLDLMEECLSEDETWFTEICEKLKNIILNNMLMPLRTVPPKNINMEVYDIKESQDQIKEGDTSSYTRGEVSLVDEMVSTRSDSKNDKPGLRNLMGDNFVIDLSNDLLSVTPTGYVIRTSFTDGHGVSQPCILKRCDVVDESPPDLALLQQLQHPQVVHLMDVWIEEDFLFLVMEVLDGDLTMLILRTANSTPISLHVAVDLMLQIAKGMLYLHKMGVSYTLQCDNVLYKLTDRNKTEAFRVNDVLVKLGGFGCSRPPHLESESQSAADFGLTCLEILTGYKRSDKTSESSIPEATPPILKYIIASCLKTRPTFSRIVEELERAQSHIQRTYSDDFIVPSENMEPDIVQTETDCGPEEIFAVHQLHPRLGDTCTSVRATLVFFHGLRKVSEEWRETWMTRDNTLVWPETWLPEDLGAENIRVLSVSFEENPTANNNCNRDEIGKNLVESLVLSPDWKLGESGEAIFLIGHSFGGVLIKYLVTEAGNSIKNNTGQQEALKCAKFLGRLAKIVFYSVPHASTGQEFENYVSKCKKIAPLKRSSFLQSLKGDTHFVAEMNKLSSDFETAMPEKLQILAFLEGKAMSKEFVLVTEKSCAIASKICEWHKIDKDNHFEVCRPNSKNHAGYKILLEHLHQHLDVLSSTHDSDVTPMLERRQSDDVSKASEAFPAENVSYRAESSPGSAILSATPEHSTLPYIDVEYEKCFDLERD